MTNLNTIHRINARKSDNRIRQFKLVETETKCNEAHLSIVLRESNPGGVLSVAFLDRCIILRME